ncbi:hypothetical protein FRX31_023170 [Thalictrum thalictroides]|uniref:Uncharacterized protein n=1 Tax=Thalictrum thalictroides TaxID=46969 RepID=A0A7J6VQ74_THATH|nr:hypothetical protein FRX31_023170 [Thalictrum thalictroides]
MKSIIKKQWLQGYYKANSTKAKLGNDKQKQKEKPEGEDMEVTSIDVVIQNEKKKRKRWARDDNEEKMLLTGMVEAAKKVAAALRPQKCDKIELALTQLPDMTEDDILDGMDLFGPDPQLENTFLGDYGLKLMMYEFFFFVGYCVLRNMLAKNICVFVRVVVL